MSLKADIEAPQRELRTQIPEEALPAMAAPDLPKRCPLNGAG